MATTHKNLQSKTPNLEKEEAEETSMEHQMKSTDRNPKKKNQ